MKAEFRRGRSMRAGFSRGWFMEVEIFEVCFLFSYYTFAIVSPLYALPLAIDVFLVFSSVYRCQSPYMYFA